MYFENLCFRPSWRIREARVSENVFERCVFVDRFHWIRVDGRPNRKKKTSVFKRKRIHVDGASIFCKFADAVPPVLFAVLFYTISSCLLSSYFHILLVCRWRHGGHVGGQEQKHFSPLGTKLYFHFNSSRKSSIVLTPNMAVTLLQTKNHSVWWRFPLCFVVFFFQISWHSLLDNHVIVLWPGI